MKKGTSKTDGLKLTYTYEEPKTEEESNIQESNVSRAYDILFTETINRLREKDPKGIWRNL